jgi:hypothetical protein
LKIGVNGKLPTSRSAVVTALAFHPYEALDRQLASQASRAGCIATPLQALCSRDNKNDQSGRESCILFLNHAQSASQMYAGMVLAQSKTPREPFALNAKQPSVEAFRASSVSTASPEPHTQVPLSLSNLPDVHNLLHLAKINAIFKSKQKSDLKSRL